MAKLNQFLAKVRTSGFANLNRYKVSLIPPVNSSGVTNMSSMMLYCAAVNIPGINFASNPSYIFGEQFEFAYQKTYSELSLTFYVDKNMEVKKIFDNWVQSIYNPKTREFNYYDNYVADIDLIVQDKNDKNIYFVKIKQAWPKTIQDIQMSYSDNNIMTMQIIFSYKYFEIQNGYGKDEVQNLSSGFFDDYINNFNEFQNGVKDKVISNAKEAMNSVISKFKL